MKSRLAPLCLMTLLSTALSAQAQTADPVPEIPIPSAPVLTPEQVKNITTQLKELEAQIQRMRGDNLAAILQKLRTAAGSNAAAMALYEDCEKLVNIERKDVARDEAKRAEERIERNADRRSADADEVKQNGDMATAIRIQLQYLILTLEAHEANDPAKMIPKLQAYVQELVGQADKLRGRSLGFLGAGFGGGGGGGRGGQGGGAVGVGGGRNIFVEAFQLQRFLTVEDWTNQPTDFSGMWNRTIFPVIEKEKKEDLPAQWDLRINSEGAFRKGCMPEPEYLLWVQNELPALRWERAEHLYEHGPSAINAMADMLKVVKENPGHADAPKWLKTLRELVGAAGGAGAATAP
ncbi:MAG: hypothetical protein KDK97_01920 [Verrucomicrobiales bacterium]|nr:hypothetical protein [Verrucomicrobiales bacterium]MCP5558265.1 hypothetical protein [Verrucomicrobiaceae bacterium]